MHQPEPIGKSTARDRGASPSGEQPPDLRREPGPHVFVDDLELPQLSDDDEHHLRRSLRLRDGDPFTVSDAAGRWRRCRLGATAEPAGSIHEVGAPAYLLALVIALTKSTKPELVVQKATELGIDAIVLTATERSVTRWSPDRRVKNERRLARVVREAGMQSRQVRLPSLAIADGLDEAVDEAQRIVDPATASAVAQPGKAVVARADFGGQPLGVQHRVVVVGPEGGWSPTECQMLPVTVDLGPSVLRAETAAIAVSARMVALRHRR